MKKTAVVAGLDIGSGTLKMAVARRAGERGVLELVAIAQEPSAGVRRGAVVDSDELASKIAQLKSRVEHMSSLKIEEAAVNLGGSHVSCTSSRGVVAVSRADGMVSQEDVDRVLQAAQALSLSPNQEVLEVFPRQFIVDGEAGIRDAVGMRGIRLEAEVLAVCSFSPYMRNLQSAVLGGGLEISDVIPSSLAAAAAVLQPQQKELGVAVVELGAGTTNLCVYEEGDLLHAVAFPVGAGHITSDIAIGLRTEPQVAERIKQQYGSCNAKASRKQEKVEIAEGVSLSFSRKFLSRIIEARVREILLSCNQELKRLGKQGKLPAGVVLAGGGANLPGIDEFTKKELKLPVRIGRAEGVEGFPADPAYHGVAGLLLSGTESGAASQGGGGYELFLRRLRGLMKPFIP